MTEDNSFRTIKGGVLRINHLLYSRIFQHFLQCFHWQNRICFSYPVRNVTTIKLPDRDFRDTNLIKIDKGIYEQQHFNRSTFDKLKETDWYIRWLATQMILNNITKLWNQESLHLFTCSLRPHRSIFLLLKSSSILRTLYDICQLLNQEIIWKNCNIMLRTRRDTYFHITVDFLGRTWFSII